MKVILILLSVSCMVNGGPHGFFLGLVEGLQKFKDVQSRCAEKLPSVTQAYNEIETGFNNRNLGFFLSGLNKFTNEAVLFEQVCQFKEMTSQLLLMFSEDSRDQLVVILISNTSFYVNTIASLFVSLANGTLYDIGFYLGELISKTVGYYF